MHVHEALDRLDAIHDHLTRIELYRGFRAGAVAVVGVGGIVAAIVQPLISRGADEFVSYWVAVAGINAVIGFGPALFSYAVLETEFARRRSRLVFGQFLPCLVAGAVITAAFSRFSPSFVAGLPGIWAILFGLGLISVRPHLPYALGWIGLGYLTTGCVLLAWAVDRAEPSGWAVGGVFGLGHLATALTLAANRVEEVKECDE